MKMLNPPHPGSLIKYECLEPLNLTVTAAAEGLGVTRGTLSEVINGHTSISTEMALRLEAVGWGKAEAWLGMQLDYDLAKTKQQIGKRIKLKRFPAPPPVN